MAELLKRQYDIIVLKAELLDSWQADPTVRFTLQFKVGDELGSEGTWEAHLGEMGLGRRLETRQSPRQGMSLKLPDALVKGLGDFIHYRTSGDRPLWIHLVKPYGMLRFVPWEQLLGEALKIPILMLPDFIFPPPRETSAVLEVVVCGSAPLGHEHGSIYNGISQAVDRILEASVRRTRVHVFADKDILPGLLDHWKASGQLGTTILLHEPEKAAKFCTEDLGSRVLDRTGLIRSPWLLWMRESLRGRSVDVLHFVCHGYLSRERGSLLFATSPIERTDRFLSGPVGSAELQTFLTQIGAWSTVFTSVDDNYSEPGLRALADEIAQSRPGPLMMHSLREDPAAKALVEGYRFLYASSPVPAPLSRALFIYCQPYRTTDATRARRQRGGPSLARLGSECARNDEQRMVAARAEEASPLDSLFEKEEYVSPLVASAERFAEQVQLRYQQLARDEILPKDVGERDLKLAEDMIGRLRQAVAEVSAKPEAAPPAKAFPPQPGAQMNLNAGEMGAGA